MIGHAYYIRHQHARSANQLLCRPLCVLVCVCTKVRAPPPLSSLSLTLMCIPGPATNRRTRPRFFFFHATDLFFGWSASCRKHNLHLNLTYIYTYFVIHTSVVVILLSKIKNALRYSWSKQVSICILPIPTCSHRCSRQQKWTNVTFIFFPVR